MKQFATIFIILIQIPLYAQWESMNGPYGGFINDLTQNKSFQFAATPNGVYRSNNAGVNWTKLPFEKGISMACLQIDCLDSFLVADAVDVSQGHVIRHLYKSIDNGENWAEIERPTYNEFATLAITDYHIYFYGYPQVWVSNHQDISWELSTITEAGVQAFCITSFKNNIIIGGYNKIYKSSGPDDIWTEIPVAGLVYADQIYIDDTLIFVRDYHEGTLFRSFDDGMSWENLDKKNWANGETQFARIENDYYVSIPEGLYKSSDFGVTWKDNSTIGMRLVYSMIAVDTTLIAGCWYRGIYRSNDFGKVFHFSSEGIDASIVTALTINNKTLLTGSVYLGVSANTLETNQWHDQYFEEHSFQTVEDLKVFNGKIYMLADSIFEYSEADQEWVPTYFNTQYRSWELYNFENTIYAGGRRIYETCDLNPVYRIEIDEEVYYPCILLTGENDLFAAEDRSVFISEDNGFTWKKTPGVFETGQTGYKDIQELYYFDGLLFAVFYNLDHHHSRLFLSTDKGNSWNIVDDGIPLSEVEDSGIKTLTKVNQLLIATTYGHKDGVYISPIENIYWTPFNESLPSRTINRIIYDDDFLYAATSGKGVWRRKIEDLTTTSIPQANSKQEFKIYPNPTSGSFHIQLPDGIENGKIEIFDSSGKSIYTDHFQSENSIHIESIKSATGIYFAVILTQNAVYNAKLIIY